MPGQRSSLIEQWRSVSLAAKLVVGDQKPFPTWEASGHRIERQDRSAARVRARKEVTVTC